MIEAARRADFDYYQRGRLVGAGRFIPTPDAVIRAMLQAALGDIPDDHPTAADLISRVVTRKHSGPEIEKRKATKPLAATIITARKPRPRR
jgi:hypothetical protein